MQCEFNLHSSQYDYRLAEYVIEYTMTMETHGYGSA